ncbi:MAG: HlyD family secretion protein [Rhodopila sp.]|nr:HlyD family secretion protein [Rhodopila sp.]
MAAPTRRGRRTSGIISRSAGRWYPIDFARGRPANPARIRQRTRPPSSTVRPPQSKTEQRGWTSGGLVGILQMRCSGGLVTTPPLSCSPDQGFSMPDATEAMRPAPSASPRADHPARFGWLFPLLRIMGVIAAGFLAWYVAGHWNRWTGSARYEATDDAYTAGDVTPLAAKVSGYVATVAVTDYQTVHKGDLIVEIDPSDYRAELTQAEASLAAAQAALADLANQKDVQRALIRQADATIQATQADLLRYDLEAKRQRSLLQTRIAGTEQMVEQADANENRTKAQLMLNEAQLDQQKAVLASLDVQENRLKAQVRGAEAQLTLARDNLAYTRIVSPADGLVGQRQVRDGQFVNAGTQVIAMVPLPRIWVIANFKETQMTNVRLGEPARVTVDAFPNLRLTGHVDSWSPGTGSTFALLPPDNATGNFTKVVQRMPVKIVLDTDPALGTLVRPGMSVEATIDTGTAEDRMPTAGSTQKARSARPAPTPAPSP